MTIFHENTVILQGILNNRYNQQNKINMKKITVLLLSATLILSGCSSWSKTAKGGLLGGGAGAALGAGIGVLIGGDAQSARDIVDIAALRHRGDVAGTVGSPHLQIAHVWHRR